jgi:hypothetical protein
LAPLAGLLSENIEMIHVSLAAEPENFNERVRIPGNRFLRTNSSPSKEEWGSHSYWQDVLRDLWLSYDKVCAYSCHFIAADTGSRSVDHFVSKHDDPALAYEWSNYRLAASRLNARKGRKKILDPFKIFPGTFSIQFPSLQVVPGPLCKEDVDLRTWAIQTCDILGLNDETTCITNRQNYVETYCSGDCSFMYLRREAPFLAYELMMQGLVELDAIRPIMTWHFKGDDLLD